MWSSLKKILRWPDDTRIYCAHEYTQSNARFALTVEPQNLALRARADSVAKLRAAGKPTIPSTLGEERATNPFLRAASADLRATIGLPAAEDVDVFAKTRALKDAF
jgi:hydroxyacylglutathione hydrolase